MNEKQSRWKNKIDALLRLAENQRGKPEGDLARAKLDRILRMYPLAKEYEPVQEFTMRDVEYMRKNGISTNGRWEGANFDDAISAMISDYRGRVEQHRAPKLTSRRVV